MTEPPWPKGRTSGIELAKSFTAEEKEFLAALSIELIAAWHGEAIGWEREGEESFKVYRVYEHASHMAQGNLEAHVRQCLERSGHPLKDDVLPAVPTLIGNFCFECGCSDFNACEGGCGWAKEGQCTACAAKAPAEAAATA